MKKKLSIMVLLAFFALNAIAQNEPYDLYVGTTNNMWFNHGNAKDSTGGPVVPYEGNTQYVFSFETTGWYGGNGSFLLNPNPLDFTPYTHIEFAQFGIGTVGSELRFQLEDADENQGPEIVVSIIEEDGTYSISQIELSTFKGASSLDLSAVKFIRWVAHGSINEIASGTFYLDYVRLLDETATSVASKTLTEVTVGPNPSNGIYKIESKDRLDQIVVFDAMGSVVQTTAVSGTSGQIDLSAKPEGVYYLRAVSGERSSTTKLIKN